MKSVVATLAVVALTWAVPAWACEPPIERIRQTSYLMGEMAILRPDGQEVRRQEVLMRRIQDPMQKRFEEEVVLHASGEPLERFGLVILVDPEKNTFQVANDSGAITGHGTLEGQSWRWSRWRTTIQLPGGRKVVWNNLLDGPGMTAEGTLFDAQGQVQFLLKENLRHVNQTEFDLRRTQLLSN